MCVVFLRTREQRNNNGCMTQKDDGISADDELQKLREIAARAQADLQNAKMRMEKEAQEIRVFSMQGLI